MRIGVVSDTHGEVWTTQEAARMFDSLRVDLVIHCGDVGTPDVVRQFADRPCHFVLGNMDDIQRTSSPSVAVIDLPSLEVTAVPL